MDGRQPRAEGQGVDTCVVGINQRVGAYVEGLYAAIECSERGNDIFRATDFEDIDFETKLAGCGMRLADMCGGILDISDDRQSAKAG